MAKRASMAAQNDVDTAPRPDRGVAGSPRVTRPRSALASLLESFSRQGRGLIERYVPFASAARDRGGAPTGADAMVQLARALLSVRGEASGIAIAADLLSAYDGASGTERAAFFAALAGRFDPDPARLAEAWAAYLADGSVALPALAHAVEAPRQELFRRLNLAPGGTAALVRLRADLLAAMRGAGGALDAVDADLSHLLQSWFNRGFLTMREIDWSSPAHLLERVIRYEAVHHIDDWDDLRSRLDPSDRRCFGFFHPAMPDEPLIFVEVALTRGIPVSIQAILHPDRHRIAAEDADTAAFYSISNCQAGLRGISFGHFLIKQVAADLKRALPGLTRFVTLSPIPGLIAWLTAAAEDDAARAMIARLQAAAWWEQSDAPDLEAWLMPRAVRYFTEARTPGGKPIDPVARFHLGNGARLEQLDPRADLSPNGLQQSAGLMVNYLYDLPRIEELHEDYVERGQVALGAPFRHLADTLARHSTARRG